MGNNRKINQIVKPNFLGIGATKAATSWLNSCLSRHSQIYMPPMKELSFFFMCQGTAKQFLQSCHRRLPQVVKETIKGIRVERPTLTLLLLWHLLPIQSRIFALIHPLFYPKKIYRIIIQRDTANLGWYTKFFFGRLILNPERWYKSLFEPREKQICGEITPGYSVLQDSTIEYMLSFNKHMRIIYLIRNPIERDWSNISMFTGNPGGSLPMSEVKKRAHRTRAHSDYLSNLKRYLKYVAPKNLFLGFYEDILFHQNRFLAAVQEFLGVSEEDIALGPRHSGGYKGIKLEYAVYLAQRNLLNIKEMASIFGGYTSFWLNVASELCQSDTTISSDETFISTPFATNDRWRSRWECSSAKDFQSGPLSSLPCVNKLIP